MEAVQDPDKQQPEPGRLRLFIGQLNWRMILVRLVINGLTLIAIAVLVPNIYFVDRRFGTILIMAVGLGILNAFVKPIVQFLTLPFIFATYGFVIVLINTVILLLMAAIFEQRFYVGGLFWAFVGGLVMGVFASFLESLLGLNLPIFPKSEEADGSPVTESRAFTDLLVNEVAGEKPVPPAPSQDVSEPAQAEASTETDRRPPTAEDAQAQLVTKPAAVSRPPSAVEAEAGDKQPGDEG